MVGMLLRVQIEGDAESRLEQQEKRKLVVDYMKHVATLSSALIVTVGFLYDKNPKEFWWADLALVSFLGSIYYSLFAIWLFLRNPLKARARNEVWAFRFVGATLISFVVGMLCLTALASFTKRVGKASSPEPQHKSQVTPGSPALGSTGSSAAPRHVR